MLRVVRFLEAEWPRCKETHQSFSWAVKGHSHAYVSEMALEPKSIHCLMSKLQEPTLYLSPQALPTLVKRSQDQREPIIRWLPDLETFYQDTDLFFFLGRHIFL